LLINASLRGRALIAAEEDALGIGYPEIGYLLANEWGLPEELCDGIRFHYTPDMATKNKEVVDTVGLSADLVDSVYCDGEPFEEFARRNARLCVRANVSEDDLLQILDAAEANVNGNIRQFQPGERLIVKAPTKVREGEVLASELAGACDWLHAIDDEGKTPLERGLSCGNAEVTDIVVRLQDDGGNVGDIFLFARAGDVRRVRELIEAGEDVDQEDANGLSLLHYAALNGNLDLAKLVVNRGATVTRGPSALFSTSPFVVAKAMGYHSITAFLALFGIAY